MTAPIDENQIAAQALIRETMNALEVLVEPIDPDDQLSEELRRRAEDRTRAQAHREFDVYLDGLKPEDRKNLSDPERRKIASLAYVDGLKSTWVVDKGTLEAPGRPISIGGVLIRRSISIPGLIAAVSALFASLSPEQLAGFKPWPAVTMSASARRKLGLRERPAQQKEANNYDEQPRVEPTTGMEFVWIPPGEFMMGCSPGDTECADYEKPQHRVRITKGFEMGKYPVTQAHWEAVMGNNPSKFKGADRPVEMVSWDDTQSFLTRLNDRRDGYRYRLPTEAEWEYAARAGSTQVRYGELDAIGWYRDNAGQQTHQVGRKAPNAWGLYDTLGNVWEWCQDWYGKDYYASSPREDPRGPDDGKYPVLRGGSWSYNSGGVRTSNRFRFELALRSLNAGFRCVREANSL